MIRAITFGFKALSFILVMRLPVDAQQFTINAVETGGEFLHVYYDLIDTTFNRTYTVFAYSSKDNFLAPVKNVSGDGAGLEIRPGINRKITINVKQEFGANFKGDLEFEIRGRVYIPFIRFEGINDVPVRKRGVEFPLKWSGGTRQNILNFQLYRKTSKGNVLAHTFENVPNTSEHKFIIPAKVRPGKNYYLRVSDIKNADQVVVTNVFSVKRKYPHALKVLAIGGICAAIITQLPDGKTDELKGPPAPPE